MAPACLSVALPARYAYVNIVLWFIDIFCLVEPKIAEVVIFPRREGGSTDSR